MSERMGRGPEESSLPTLSQRFDEYYNLLRSPKADPMDLGAVIGAVLETAIPPRNASTLHTIRLYTDVLADQYAFDATSTRYGDRTTDHIIEDREGGSFSDPDGSGRRSVNQKRAHLTADLVCFLVASPDCIMNETDRVALLLEARDKLANLNSQGTVRAMGLLYARMAGHAKWYEARQDTANLQAIMRVCMQTGLDVTSALGKDKKQLGDDAKE